MQKTLKERLKNHLQYAWWQYLALALAAVTLMAAAGILAWRRGAALDGIWLIPAAGAGLMLLLAPVMGYFSEEESKYD